MSGRADRRALVERAVGHWVDQLIDLSGRNQLLSYRSLPRGTLELTDAEPSVRAALLSGATVRLSRLFPPTGDAGGEGAAPADAAPPAPPIDASTGEGRPGAARRRPDRTDDAFRRARTIHAKALALFEEKGIQTLFVALGLATWTAPTSTSTPAAPVLLRPLVLRPRGAAETDFDAVLHGDWVVNDALLHLLRSDFGVEIDGAALLDAAQATPGGDVDAAEVFARLGKQAGEVPGFTIAERTVAGTFAYTKLPMVTDLREHVDELAAHDLIAAIAGDAGARQQLREVAARVTDPTRPDRTAPADEFLILDADASQNAAINAALGGQPLIVEGPPGTGKSQTIANLVATLTAQGRRVLFVAEKRAAIDAVTRRLAQVGLGDLVMDLHGGVTSKRRLAADIAHTLEQMRNTPAVDAAYLHHRLTSSREALTDHAAALHEVRDPWGVSIFEVDERLLALGDAPAAGLRFAGARLRDLDAATVRVLRDELVEWAGLTAALRGAGSPWAGAVVETERDAQDVLDLLGDLTAETVPDAAAQLDAALADTGLPRPDTIAAWEPTLDLLDDVAATLQRMTPEIFAADLDELAAALAPGTRGRWGRALAHLSDRGYRDAKRSARALWRAGSPDGAQLHAAVGAARDQAARWRELGGQGPPCLPARLDAAATAYGALADGLATLAAYLITDDLRQRPHDAVDDDLAALLADQRTLFRLPRIRALEEHFAQCHLQGFMQAVERGRIDRDTLVAAFDHAWLSSIRAQVSARDPRLANFDGRLHDSHVEQFASADRGHIDLTARRVRRAVAEHAVAVRDRHGEQSDLVAGQANRKRGHLPLRELFERAPDVLTALRPCWAMSPLVVSQTLPAAQIFDVVIFDEASQVQPADAVPALLRAPLAVVAGDRRQLPPTTFFDAAVDSDDADSDDAAALTTGFESVLDVVDPLLRSYRLTWHYRSRDERLIAFSNHAVYGGTLVTFPSAHDDAALAWEPVAHQPGRDVDSRSSDAEVARVVDLMVTHARRRPRETLGVITMGQHHAGRIEAALRDRIAAERDRDLDAFFDEAAPERAFVKNLERVQGDERDAIILSIGYGRQADGRLLYRFGPLNAEGGERRLNVAVTRARRRLTLVSSLAHTDMDPGRSSARGVELLRGYLQYAASGGAAFGAAGAAPDHRPFEREVLQRLADAGLPVRARHGASDLRVDVALAHPTRPGRMALAVETDGPAYRAAATTRDRDRLRQQVLERLGWRYHRVWSTAWLADPEREVARVVSAYRHACEDIDLGRHEGAAATGHAAEGASTTAASPAAAAIRPRGARPEIPPGRGIAGYSMGELIQMVRWIRSDTLLRTEEQLLDELVSELGFTRRGTRIVAELRRAIARA